MAYCRFCGKELVNGQCDCAEFQASIGNAQKASGAADTVNGQGAPEGSGTARPSWENAVYREEKDPFLVPSFNLDFSSPRKFATSFKRQCGLSDPNSTTTDPYERNILIVPDLVEPEEGEHLVKQYNIAKLRSRSKFMKAEGHLAVTDKRVIFRAAGTSLSGNVVQQQQFRLDEIAGIEIHKDHLFSKANLVLALLLYCPFILFYINAIANKQFGGGSASAINIIIGILGLLPTFIVYKRFWMKLLLAILANYFLTAAIVFSRHSAFLIILMLIANIVIIANIIVVCNVPNLMIVVKTTDARAVVIGGKRALAIGNFRNSYTGFAEVLPYHDTVPAMAELGKVITALQHQRAE